MKKHIIKKHGDEEGPPAPGCAAWARGDVRAAEHAIETPDAAAGPLRPGSASSTPAYSQLALPPSAGTLELEAGAVGNAQPAVRKPAPIDSAAVLTSSSVSALLNGHGNADLSPHSRGAPVPSRLENFLSMGSGPVFAQQVVGGGDSAAFANVQHTAHVTRDLVEAPSNSPSTSERARDDEKKAGGDCLANRHPTPSTVPKMSLEAEVRRSPAVASPRAGPNSPVQTMDGGKLNGNFSLEEKLQSQGHGKVASRPIQDCMREEFKSQVKSTVPCGSDDGSVHRRRRKTTLVSSSEEGDSDDGEVSKRRSKLNISGCADDGSTRKRTRAAQLSSSEERDSDEENEEEDSSEHPPLEAKIGSVKGAWFDIELLASDPSSEYFHVRTRDHGDKEWVTAGEIRYQCAPYEDEKPPMVGTTVCVFTARNKKDEEEMLYFDGHVNKICHDGRFEVALLDGPSGHRERVSIENIYEINTETIPMDTLRSWCTRVYKMEQKPSGPRKVILNKGDFAMFEAPEKNESFRVGQLRQAYTGEICDEWSDDEDGPMIRVRWFPTAAQLKRRKKGKALVQGRCSNPHEVFACLDWEETIDARTLVDQCHMSFYTSGAPETSELETWNSNEMYAAFAYDREQALLLPLNNESLPPRLKKVLKRSQKGDSITGSVEGTSCVKEEQRGDCGCKPPSNENGNEKGREIGKDYDCKSGGNGGILQDGADVQASSKKRERQESDEKHGKNGRPSQADMSKMQKKQSSSHYACKSSGAGGHGKTSEPMLHSVTKDQDGNSPSLPADSQKEGKADKKAEKERLVKTAGGCSTENVAGRSKTGKSKTVSKRRSVEGAAGASSRTGSCMVRSKDGAVEDAEGEESDSGHDISFSGAVCARRKIVPKKVTMGNKKKIVDTESTDSNGIISGAGSPAPGGSCSAVACDDVFTSPSCHGFGAHEVCSSRRVSASKSTWKILPRSLSSDEHVVVGAAAEGIWIPAGPPICIALDLRDGVGKEVENELDQVIKSITVRGYLRSSAAVAGSGDAVWTRGLESSAQVHRVGGLLFCELRFLCRVGKYILKATMDADDFVQEYVVNVVAGPPSLQRSTLTLLLVDKRGVSLGSKARNGKHSARAATAPLLMGCTSSVGQMVHGELSVTTLCDGAGNSVQISAMAMQELTAKLQVMLVRPLAWSEAQSSVDMLKKSGELEAQDLSWSPNSEITGSGEGRLFIQADTESLEVSATPVSSSCSAGYAGTGCRVRLFSFCPSAPGNHVLLFSGRSVGGPDDAGSLLFHVDFLVCKKCS